MLKNVLVEIDRNKIIITIMFELNFRKIWRTFYACQKSYYVILKKKRNPRMSVEPIKNLSVFSYTSDENKYYGVRGWVNGVNNSVK